MSSYLGNGVNGIPYLYNSGVQNSRRLKYTPPNGNSNVNIVYVQDQKLADQIRNMYGIDCGCSKKRG